ncbi:unnamed protein product [Mesocestoides corti]|uniref:ascorbate ferrireductase (transmembrane) n=1 Tax=Mesocestoides corti TaxID=53468 RepID=A0A0R3UFZ3_MESCO|nr:unnamed protein product [Mesocestoides corti]
MAVHVTSLLLILSTVYFVWPLNSLFLWHPFLMMLGLCGFALQGIIIYNNDSSLALHFPGRRKYKFHWVLHVLGLVTMFAGFGVIFKVKIDNNKSHMTTWHSRLGCLFLLGVFSQVIFGFLRTTPFIRSVFKPYSSRLLHACLGAIFFTLGCLTSGLGLCSDWFRQKALVDSIDDHGVRLLVFYVLLFFFCLSASVTLKQVYDKYLVTNTSEVLSKKNKNDKKK